MLDHAADPTTEAKFHSSPMEDTSNPEIKRLLTEAIARYRSVVRKYESTNSLRAGARSQAIFLPTKAAAHDSKHRRGSHVSTLVQGKSGEAQGTF
jgi:alpha-beta hydrolase superfamily lysophospholipase